MSAKKTLVTVYVTTCNRAELLSRALDSVIAQDYRPLEVIVVDDASTDNTDEVMASYQALTGIDSDFELIALKHEQNRGACAARNSAISVAKGEFITGLDDDDEFMPGRISGLVSSWTGEYSALCTAKEVDEGGGKFSYLNKYIGRITLNALLKKNIVGSQVFTTTQRLQDIGGFDEAFPAWQDYETWIRMVLSYGDMLKLPEVSYRVHIGHDKPRITSHQKSLDAMKLLRAKHGHCLSRHHLRQLQYRELTAAKTEYSNLSVWLPAMTWRTFPRIIKRWFKATLSGTGENVK